MAILSKPSFAPGAAVIYVTFGALLNIWTAVYYLVFRDDVSPEARHTQLFWVSGFFLTGLVLIVIGFTMGHIGRAARRAEMPPPEVTPQAAQAELNAASTPAAIVPPAPAIIAKEPGVATSTNIARPTS